MIYADEIYEQIVNDPSHNIFEISGQFGCGITEILMELGYLFYNNGKQIKMFERSEYVDIESLKPGFSYIKATMNDLSTILDLMTNYSDSVCIVNQFKFSDNEINFLIETTSHRMNTIIITKQNDGEMMFKPIVC